MIWEPLTSDFEWGVMGFRTWVLSGFGALSFVLEVGGGSDPLKGFWGGVRWQLRNASPPWETDDT